jgi:hypothetical protein
MIEHELNDELLIQYRIQSDIIQREKAKLLALNEKIKDLRKSCKHDFTVALNGYEHEGGICKICGIGEIFSKTLKKYE